MRRSHLTSEWLVPYLINRDQLTCLGNKLYLQSSHSYIKKDWKEII